MTTARSRRGAEAAFETGDFASAYRAYIDLWHRHRDTNDLVWAARSLERAQQWRATIAMWEEVARSISDGPHGLGPKGRDSLFDRLQKHDEHWRNPPDADHVDYYKGKDGRANRHRRAWALHWAAEQASAAQRHELAARLHRSAAFAWTTTSWGDKNTSEWDLDPQWSPSPGKAPRSSSPTRPHDDSAGDIGESERCPRDALACDGAPRAEAPELVNDDPRGEKWELAACSFFYSVMEGIESKLRDRKDPIDEVYALDDGDLTFLRGFSAGPKEVPSWLKRGDTTRLSDTDRLVLCYEKWAEVRCDDTRPDARQVERDSVKRKSCEKAYEALGAIEGALTRVGRRADAKALHIRKQRLLRESMRWRPARLFLCLKWMFGDGARSWVPFLWAAAFWIGVFPGIFAGLRLVYHGADHRAASSVDSVIFSIANALTISVGDLQTRGLVGGLVQILNTVVIYALFGVALYTLTRSFEE